MDSFQQGVLRNQKAVAKKLNAKATDTFGPNLAEFSGQFTALPALRGLWFASNADNTGNVFDSTGQGRTLTRNGTPAIRMFTVTSFPALLPHYDLNGTTDFFSRADEAGLDVLGTEAYVAGDTRGLTMGGWFRADSLTGTPGLMGKQNATGAQRGYLLRIASSAVEGRVSVDGTAEVTVTGATLVASSWYFVVLRYTPSVDLSVFVNGTKATNTTSIPANLFNNTAAFQIGAYNAGTQFLQGRWVMSFLCAAALSDGFIIYLYNRSVGHFGV